MANEIIRPTQLPARADPVASEVVPSDNGSVVGGVTWADGVNAAVPPASQPESEAGAINTKRMTPLTTKQAIDAQVPPKISAAIGALNLGSASQSQVEDFATAVQGAKADSAVQPSRTVGTGTGLTGGGDLSSDRTISLSSGTIASLQRADSSVQTVNGNPPDGSGNVSVDAEFLQEQNSVTTAMAAFFALTVEWVRTAGYSTPGDGGGALYKRALSEPSHAGKFQSADGAWWELAEAVVTPQMFGAKGDGASDDSAAVNNAILIGLPIYWGNRTYRITETIALTLNAPIKWRSSGARLLVDTPSSVQYAFNINVNGQNVSIEGELRLNANMKAFTGWRFLNNTDTYVDFIAKDFGVYDVYRSSTAFTGGDGLFIDGAYRRVFLENFYAKDMVLAAGAGVSGTQGVFGATIKATGPTRYPRSVTLINPYIENVYSEDIGYTADQDGVRIFTAEDQAGVPQIYDSHFLILGGSFINCGNRSIKSQFEQGSVIGTRFVRDGVLLPQIARSGTATEIDFQVGGGIVENIECRYHNSSPIAVVSFQGSRQSGKYVTGASAKDVRVSKTGSGVLGNLVTVVGRENSFLMVNLEGIDHNAPNATTGAAVLVNNQNGQTVQVNISNIKVRCTGAVVQALANGGIFRVSGRNLTQVGASVPVAITSGTTTMVKNLDGLNVSVTA